MYIDAIDHVAHDDGPLAAATLAGRDERFDKRPFFVGQIARITQLVAVVAGAIFGRPHRHLQNESVPHKESQQIPAFQAAASANRLSPLAKSPDGHLDLRQFFANLTMAYPVTMNQRFPVFTAP